PAAERAQIPIALMASHDLPAAGRIAERHPDLRLLIDHFGRVRGAQDDAAHANQPALLALAKYPNVAVKATGAPGNSSQPYPYRNIHKYIQQIYDAFAPQRIFWGTDRSPDTAPRTASRRWTKPASTRPCCIHRGGTPTVSRSRSRPPADTRTGLPSSGISCWIVRKTGR